MRYLREYKYKCKGKGLLRTTLDVGLRFLRETVTMAESASCHKTWGFETTDKCSRDKQQTMLHIIHYQLRADQAAWWSVAASLR